MRSGTGQTQVRKKAMKRLNGLARITGFLSEQEKKSDPSVFNRYLLRV
jgi:hypothetical protein